MFRPHDRNVPYLKWHAMSEWRNSIVLVAKEVLNFVAQIVNIESIILQKCATRNIASTRMIADNDLKLCMSLFCSL